MENNMQQLDGVINFDKILGYNPFIDKKSNNARLGKRMLSSYIYYFDMLSLLCQIAYKWENIPEEIPIYQIEKCLFYTGQMGFTYDEIMKQYIALPCVANTQGYDIYGEPKRFTMFSYAITTKYNVENKKDGLICYNNAIKKNNYYMAYRYANRLQMIDDIIDQNIDKQKCPYIILANDDKERLSLKQLINKLDLNEPAIYSTKDLTKEQVTALDLRVDLKSEELMNAKREIFNEACLYMGIASTLSQKKERLITSEIENENQRYGIYRAIGLQPRQYFCNQVNKKYGLNISVDFVLNEETIEEIGDKIVNTTNSNRQEEQEG